ncbi:MAG: cyclase family protein [Sphingobacteriales bacterium]|nr:MAG: cyclase family protein [Sphingobacteriales bacterium]
MRNSSSSAWIDISATLSNDSVVWPGNKPMQIEKASKIGVGGADCNSTNISMNVHTGTHMDAPLHFIEDGNDIMRTDIDALIGHAKIFHIKDDQHITYNEIKDFPIEQGDRILFRTRNSDVDWEMAPFVEDYVYLSPDAARFLVEKEVRTVGIDYLSVAEKGNAAEVHKILLNAPVHVIEGLRLNNVEPGDYEMICLPMKVKGSDGAPARVVIKPYNKSAN